MLRPVRTGDEKAIHEYAGDKAITMMLWLPNETFEQTVDFVKKSEKEWNSPNQTFFDFVIIPLFITNAIDTIAKINKTIIVIINATRVIPGISLR